MTRNQKSHYAMFLAVKHVFEKFATQLNSIPILQKQIEEFVSRIEQIDSAIAIQEGRITGFAEQKQKEEKEMIDATARIAAALYVYALDQSNFELAEKVNINPSEFTVMDQKYLHTTCCSILNLLKEVDSQVVEYGITPEDGDMLEKEINDFSSIMASPRNEIVTRSEATSRLKGLMKDQNTLLNQKTDRMMLSFKTSNTTLYNAYKSARIIVNMGKHTAETIEEAEA